MTDHFRWRSLDELMPVRLVQPGDPPTREELMRAVGRFAEKTDWYQKPSNPAKILQIRNMLRRAAGLPEDCGLRRYPSLPRIKDRPDTWAAVIKFCDEYQPDPTKEI